MRSFGVFYAFLGMPPEFYTSKAAARRTSHLCTVSQQITFGLQRLTLPPPQVRSRGCVVVRQHGFTQPEASEELYATRCLTRSLARAPLLHSASRRRRTFRAPAPAMEAALHSPARNGACTGRTARGARVLAKGADAWLGRGRGGERTECLLPRRTHLTSCLMSLEPRF